MQLYAYFNEHGKQATTYELKYSGVERPFTTVDITPVSYASNPNVIARLDIRYTDTTYTEHHLIRYLGLDQSSYPHIMAVEGTPSTIEHDAMVAQFTTFDEAYDYGYSNNVGWYAPAVDYHYLSLPYRQLYRDGLSALGATADLGCADWVVYNGRKCYERYYITRTSDFEATLRIDIID